MKTVKHASESRGGANYGWLNTRHTFSFSNYYDPSRMGFGALRVLNDDIIDPGTGFGQHPHDNMEIISIPLSGSLAHRDTLGTNIRIESEEVQVMSAGTGIQHSEMNGSTTDKTNFLQIWIFPSKRNIAPRYDQKRFDYDAQPNSWVRVIDAEDDKALWINQDARLALTKLEEGKSLNYTLKSPLYGVYLFVIDGKLIVNGETLNTRDGLAISETAEFELTASQNSRILAIEVPLS
jgi:quercetin 2,3-dioxygenase